MARVTCLAAVALHSDTPPTAGPGTSWPIGGFDRTTPEGKKKWDVLAALIARVTKWRVEGTGAIAGSSGAATFDGTFAFDVVLSSTVNAGGSATVPEKQFAVPFTGYDRMHGNAENIGSWTETGTGPDPVTGDYLLQVNGNWRLADSSPCSVVVGKIGYPMFVLQIDLAPAEGSLIPIHSLTATTGSPSSVSTGNVTVRIPDWMAGAGFVEWEAALFAPDLLDDDDTRTITLDVTMTPEECLPYGLDPADPAAFTALNRLWNDDGTANENPLTAARV